MLCCNAPAPNWAYEVENDPTSNLNLVCMNCQSLWIPFNGQITQTQPEPETVSVGAGATESTGDQYLDHLIYIERGIAELLSSNGGNVDFKGAWSELATIIDSKPSWGKKQLASTMASILESYTEAEEEEEDDDTRNQ